MNLLQKIWSWLTSLFRQAPIVALPPTESEGECCDEECEPEEDCCDHEDCEPAPEPIIEVHVKEEPEPVVVEAPVATAPAGELLKEILIAEGIRESVIEKHQITKAFEDWYDGVVDESSVRASIQDFKSAQGGAINAKLNRIQ